MATSKNAVLKLEGMDDILNFGMPPSKSKQQEIEIALLEAYPDHKYKLYEGERLRDMVDSIRANGIMLPIIVWLYDNRHIILSGHNRVNAARLAGLDTVPCIIKEDLSCDDAATIVHETNLMQRSFSDMSYSERAYGLAQHYDSIKSQGKRKDLISEIENLSFEIENSLNNAENLTSSQIETKLRSDEIAGRKYGLSRAMIARYVRIGTYLGKPLFKLLDNEQLSFSAAYLVSFLSTSMQDTLADLVSAEKLTLDIKKAAIIKDASECQTLTCETMYDILSDRKVIQKGDNGNKAVKRTISLKPMVYERYFKAEQSKKEIEDIIACALDAYFAKADE